MPISKAKPSTFRHLSRLCDQTLYEIRTRACRAASCTSNRANKDLLLKDILSISRNSKTESLWYHHSPVLPLPSSFRPFQQVPLLPPLSLYFLLWRSSRNTGKSWRIMCNSEKKRGEMGATLHCCKNAKLFHSSI